VRAAYLKVLDAAKRHDDVAVIGGPILNPTPASCRKALDDGIRILAIPPDTPGNAPHIEELRKLNAQIKQKHEPTAEDLARHPSMHRTDTLDCIYCAKGEIHLIIDVDDVIMRPGDSVVIRGTNHAWSNQETEPCLFVGCMIDATPQT